MRNLKKNLSVVNYKKYIGSEDIIDEYGNPTGYSNPQYGELQSADMCVSSGRNTYGFTSGNYEIEPFGGQSDYDRVMTTSDALCDINEESIIWLDGKSTEEPHNYIVRRRMPWKNSILFTLKEVKVEEKEVEETDEGELLP